MNPKIVVLTPVRNEEWILDRFLAVTSRVADQIIVIDQGSTDASREICRRYEKVHLIHNTDPTYNEASRQRRLIEEARTLVPGPRILLALDSDEMVAANAVGTEDWKRMLGAAPGTVLYFEKPDLYQSTREAIRYAKPWPLGYVDDGYEHNAKVIHSIRIPQPPHAQHLRLDQVKVVHYGLTRMDAQRSKLRFYSALENVNGTTRLNSRRKSYGPRRDFAKGGTLQASDPAWFAGWQDAGIDMFAIATAEHYWQDFEVLKMFNTHGYRRFWLDDLWDFDWETLRRQALARGEPGIPSAPVDAPPASLIRCLRLLDTLRDAWATVRS